MSQRPPSSFPGTVIDNNRRKKPRLSSPARLPPSTVHATSKDRTHMSIATGSSTRTTDDSATDDSFTDDNSTDDSSAALAAATAAINPTTHDSPTLESEQIPISYGRSRGSSQPAQTIGSTGNRRSYSTTQSSGGHSPDHVQPTATVRKHNRGVGDADTKTSKEFLTKLEQFISVRTDSSKSVLKYRTDPENRKGSYSGRRISASNAAEPQSSSPHLPPRELADQLVQSYLKWENVNLPIFDIRSFQSMYENFWERRPFPGDPDIFYSMLNMVFALGYFILGKPRRDDASVFYHRAQKTMNSRISYDETISHVQVYLLSSRYLYATGLLDPAWSRIGLAISIAQSLGLHLTSGSQTLKNREDRELVRKVWHSCVVIQRYLQSPWPLYPAFNQENVMSLSLYLLIVERRTIAMAKGLSTVTSSPLVPFPTPLESEYIDLEVSGEQSSVTEKPSIIEFFNGLAKLYGKFEEITVFHDELRSMGVGLSGGKLKAIGLEPLLNLDRFLSDWKESLPSFLQPGNTHPALENPIVLRHHNILQIHYLHTHLVLRRPFLSIVVTSSGDSFFSSSIDHSNNRIRNRYTTDTPLSVNIIRDSALRCVVLAREILDILDHHRDYKHSKKDEPELLPPWWDNVGYIYACSATIIASRTCSLIRTELSQEFIEEGWQLGVKLLESYIGYSNLVKKCLSALNIMVGVTGGGVSDGEANGNDGRSHPQQLSNCQIQAFLESLPADLED